MISWADRWTQTPYTTLLQSNKMKCSFLYYVQLLMISRAGQWTRTPSTTLLQWKNEMLIFGLCSTSDERPGWSMESNPICHLSPAKEWNAYFWIMFNFWWLVRLVDGLDPHPPPLSRQKMKCSFLDYVQLLMIGQVGQWTRTRLPPLSRLKNEMLIFGLHSSSDDQQGWLMDLNPICHPSPAKKMKCLFLYYIQLLMIGQAGWWTWTKFTTHLLQKSEMLIFGLRSTSDDQPGWSMDSNPICHPSPAKKMKWSFFNHVQLLMIGRDGWWIWAPSATHLQPKKWNAHFWIMFNFWWLAGLVDGLKPHPPPLYRKRMICSFLYYIQLLMISRAGWWTWTPSATHLQPEKWNACFWITFKFWWLAGLVDELKPHLPPLSSQKNEMLIFGLRSTSDDWPGWSMDANPICHPSPAKKWNADFWITFNFWWSA